MRKIKFRAKRVDNGEWIYGYYAKTVTSEDVSCVTDTRINDIIILKDGTFYYVKPETVCQYIGIKDKNGKEIYKGDIVRDFTNDLYEVICEEYKFNLKDYYCGCFDNPNDGFSECYVGVVGNIYDNPDLLEESK